MVVEARAGEVRTAELEKQNERIAAEVSNLRERHMAKPPVSWRFQNSTRPQANSAGAGLYMLGDQRAGLSGKLMNWGCCEGWIVVDIEGTRMSQLGCGQKRTFRCLCTGGHDLFFPRMLTPSWAIFLLFVKGRRGPSLCPPIYRRYRGSPHHRRMTPALPLQESTGRPKVIRGWAE